MAGLTRLELAASCVTGMRSNQLNYNPDLNHRVPSAPTSVSMNALSFNPLRFLKLGGTRFELVTPCV